MEEDQMQLDTDMVFQQSNLTNLQSSDINKVYTNIFSIKGSNLLRRITMVPCLQYNHMHCLTDPY